MVRPPLTTPISSLTLCYPNDSILIGFVIFDLLVFGGFFIIIIVPKTTEKPNSKLEKHDFLKMGAMEISSSENHDYSVVGAGTRRAE